MNKAELVKRVAEKLEGVPQKVAAKAVDAVFDSVSVVTTFKEELAKAGVIFCSISEAIKEHPELVRGAALGLEVEEPGAARARGRQGHPAAR